MTKYGDISGLVFACPGVMTKALMGRAYVASEAVSMDCARTLASAGSVYDYVSLGDNEIPQKESSKQKSRKNTGT